MATLGNPKNTIEVLQKYNFNFQKKFGQNFLIDTRGLEEIIDAGIAADQAAKLAKMNEEEEKKMMKGGLWRCQGSPFMI